MDLSFFTVSHEGLATMTICATDIRFIKKQTLLEIISLFNIGVDT